MTLPHKFQICTKYDRTSRYTLSLDSSTNKYVMRNVTSLDDAYDIPTTYSVRFVEEALTDGSWIMTKKLDEPLGEPELASEDRPLVFPLYCTHSDPYYQTEDKPESFFKLEKGNMKGSVVITWRDGRTQDDFWTVEDCKRLIKNRTWLVKHVGDKTEEPELVLPFTVLPDGCGYGEFTVSQGSKGYVTCTYPNGDEYPDFCKHAQAKEWIKEGHWIVKHVGEKAPESILNMKLERCNDDRVTPESISVGSVQAPQSAPLSSLTLSITADTDAAVGAVERLTQALEDLSIAYKSVIALQRAFKEGV